MRMFPTSRLLAALCLLPALLAPACKQTDGSSSERSEVSEELTLSAKVVAVDPLTRLISLQGEGGERVTVVAGPEVRNFAQIAVGDSLKVRYRESLAAEIVKPGEGVEPTSTTLTAGAAAPGAKPAASVGGQVTTTVRIESIDKERFLVVFTAPEGGLHTVRVVRPEGKEFIRGLKPGDMVRLTYNAALAISIEEE
jgi:hypothetical protein